MQPMAKPGVKAYPQARALSARPGLRVLLAVDLVLLAVAGLWGVVRIATVGDLFGWGALVWAPLTAVSTVACLGLRPRGVTWRRRLGLLGVVAVLLRNGPFKYQPWVPVLVTVWTGVIWVALLLEGRRIAAAVVEATGEEGLGDDPSRHL